MIAQADPRIRLADEGDLSAVLNTDELGTKPARRDRVKGAIEAGCCWLVESDGQVLGYMVVDTTFYGFPFVWLLIVARPFRRRGVATSLLRHAESMFTGGKLFTSTNESNHPSQRLMESFGFERSGRIDNLDDDPEIIYVKRLRSRS